MNIAKMIIDKTICVFFKIFHLDPVLVQEYVVWGIAESFALRWQTPTIESLFLLSLQPYFYNQHISMQADLACVQNEWTISTHTVRHICYSNS